MRWLVELWPCKRRIELQDWHRFRRYWAILWRIYLLEEFNSLLIFNCINSAGFVSPLCCCCFCLLVILRPFSILLVVGVGFPLLWSGFAFFSSFLTDETSKCVLDASTCKLRDLLERRAIATIATPLWTLLGLRCLLPWVHLWLLGVAGRGSRTSTTVLWLARLSLRAILVRPILLTFLLS